MKTEMIVNIGTFENRIAILEDSKMVELYIHNPHQKDIVGNIYKGIVKDNVPGMGASFLEIGLERTALLHFRDAIPDFLNIDKIDDEEFIKKVKDDIYKMGELLEEGKEVMVQVEKAPLGKKGARLTGEISIPGKYMVFIPNKNYVAISRKIYSKKEKSRLKRIIYKIRDKDVGIIVRTNAFHHSKAEFKKEYVNLKKIWKEIQEKFKNYPAPSCIYDENDLHSIIIKDLIHKNLDSVVMDSKKARNKIIKNLKGIAPGLIKKVKLYREEANIFDAFGIEAEISKIFNTRIYLESGGFIVIQQTEALVSIDVNTGGFVGDKSLENTVTITNIDAAKEIARQIRLQDLTGMIFIDFIDMDKKENREKVIKTFLDEMKKDHSPHKIFTSTPLNMIEMTRKRSKSDLLSSFFEICPCCDSVGRVLAKSTILEQIFKWLDRAEKYHPKDSFEIHINKWIHDYVEEKNIEIKKDYHFDWKFKEDNSMRLDEYKIFSLKSNEEITNLYKT